MFGWLLVKILFEELNNDSSKIKDKLNATYLCYKYKIVKIIDEQLNNYICAYVKINEFYENMPVFVYLSRERALQDLYLIDNKSSGSFTPLKIYLKRRFYST
jgi:hypothetical protein